MESASVTAIFQVDKTPVLIQPAGCLTIWLIAGGRHHFFLNMHHTNAHNEAPDKTSYMKNGRKLFVLGVNLSCTFRRGIKKGNNACSKSQLPQKKNTKYSL